MSTNLHVNISVAVGGVATATARFGVPIIVGEHSITANRQDGPYSSLAAFEAAGFTAAAAAELNGWATRFFAQNPRASQFMVGRRATSENLATTLSAIEAVDPASFYAINTLTNTPSDIMALATWTESRSKIAIAQTSSAAALAGTASTAQVTNFRFAGTPTDGTYSIQVTNAWTGAVVGTASVVRAAGTPSTNNDLATAMRSAWDAVPALAAISAAAAGATNNVLITFDGLGNLYTFTVTDPESPDGLSVQADTAGTQNPAQLLSDANFNRTALIYHDDDTEYLDAALTARCLGFNLDAPNGAGTWSYHRFNGITATRLTDPQKAQLLADNCNFYSPVRYTSGTEEAGFAFPGVMASGRFIDVTTTLDLTRARQEEALLRLMLEAAASNQPKVPYTDAGIARFQGAAMGVFRSLVNAGHFADGAVSSVTGRRTPYVDVPSAASVSSAIKQTRKLTMNGEAVYAGAINSVGDSATVGFTINLNF